MITISSDKAKVKALRNTLSSLTKNLTREMAIAVNNTAKVVRTDISRKMREKIAISSKSAKDLIRIKRKATKGNATATVIIDYEKRPSLKVFGARHAKTGVTYKLTKGGKRQLASGAFMGPRPGVPAAKLNGHAFIRIGQKVKGKGQKIARLDGISVYSLYVSNKLGKPTRKTAKDELVHQLQRRIRFLTLKAQGQLRGNQK